MKRQKIVASIALIIGLSATSGAQAATYNLGTLISTPTIQPKYGYRHAPRSWAPNAG